MQCWGQHLTQHLCGEKAGLFLDLFTCREKKSTEAQKQFKLGKKENLSVLYFDAWSGGEFHWKVAEGKMKPFLSESVEQAIRDSTGEHCMSAMSAQKKRHAQIWSQCMHSDKKLSSWRWPSAEVISLLSCNWEPSYETVSWCWSNTEKNFSNCNFVTTFRLFQVSCEYLLRSTVKSLQSITGGIIHLNLLEETNQFQVFN